MKLCPSCDFVFSCNSDTEIVSILLLNVPFLVLRHVTVYGKDFINVSYETLLKRIASFSTNRNNAYALDLTSSVLPAGVQPQVLEELEKRPGLIRVYESDVSKIVMEFFGIFQKYCHCITQMRETLIRSDFHSHFRPLYCS